MRRGGSLLGWLGVALGLWLMLRGGGTSAPVALDATRMLAYPLENTLRFALEPGAEEIKVVSWLVEPTDWPRDVRVTSPYCLRFTVLDAQEEVQRDWPIFVRARGGLVRTAEGRLHAPNWLPERTESVSDDRLTRVDLRGLVHEGGFVELSRCWSPPGARILATIFQEGETTLARRLRRLRGETGGWQKASTARFSPFSWERTPAHWQENLASRTWERLGALQRGAVRVPTVPVMTTFHKGSWLDEAALGVPVPPGGALAFNLEGPTLFRGSWWTQAGGAAVHVPTDLRVFHGGERVEEASGEVHRVGPIAVGEDVVTVVVGLAASAPGPLYFRAWTTEGDLDRAWGDPPRDAPDTRALQSLAPDFRNLELYRALPQDAVNPPLVFPVQAGEWVRVLAFARLDPALPGLSGAGDAGPGPTATVACVDALGRVLSENELPTSTIPSLFERYSQFDTPATAAPSEPETLVMQPPEGTVALRITAEAAVDVGVRVTREPDLERIVWRGYQLSEGFEADGRWVPLVRNPWRARAPEDVELLLRALRTPRIDAQVRLEEDEEPASVRRIPTPLRSLTLWQPFEVLAEPGRAERALTRLGRAAVPIPIGPAGRLFIEYRVPAEQVGSVVRLRLGDRVVERKLPAAAGTLRIDGLSPGVLAAAIDAPGLFLARAEGRPAWRAMRVQRLPAQPGPTIAVPAGSGVLVFHPYALQSGGRLRWRLLSGTGRTLASGSAPLRARGGAALPLSFAGPALPKLESVRVVLDAGNPGGNLLIWAEDAEVFVRATATWGEDRDPGAVHRPMGPAQ